MDLILHGGRGEVEACTAGKLSGEVPRSRRYRLTAGRGRTGSAGRRGLVVHGRARECERVKMVAGDKEEDEAEGWRGGGT